MGGLARLAAPEQAGVAVPLQRVDSPLRAALPGLHWCALAGDYPLDVIEALSALPAELAQAAPKRRVQYTLGRYCAGQALQAAGFAGDSWLGFSRAAPLWPQGFVGSITHTTGYVAAVAVRADGLNGVGIDVESIATARKLEALWLKVLMPSERELCRTAQGAVSTAALATLIFSVKESLYKALSARVPHRFGFADVNVTAIDPETQSLQLSLGARLADCAAVRAVFALEHERVHTAVVY